MPHTHAVLHIFLLEGQSYLKFRDLKSVESALLKWLDLKSSMQGFYPLHHEGNQMEQAS